jgi:hypothetical protein
MDLKDLYTRVKLLQRRLKFLEIHEEYIKDEVKNLKRELLHAQEEVLRKFSSNWMLFPNDRKHCTPKTKMFLSVLIAFMSDR